MHIIKNDSLKFMIIVFYTDMEYLKRLIGGHSLLRVRHISSSDLGGVMEVLWRYLDNKALRTSFECAISSGSNITPL